MVEDYRIVDEMAGGWREIERLEESLAKSKSKLKDEILRMVRRYGSVAPHSKRMKVLVGILTEIQAIYPIELAVNPDAVRALLRACPGKLGGLLFERQDRFILQPAAFELAASVLSAKTRKLFNETISRKKLAPRVKVIDRKPAERRAAAA